jgi:hypothetical protein
MLDKNIRPKDTASGEEWSNWIENLTDTDLNKVEKVSLVELLEKRAEFFEIKAKTARQELERITS